MTWRLDHLFVQSRAGAPELAALAAAGFAPGTGRRHVGQGTENRCVFFENGFVELLWLVDRAEATSPAIRDTGLAERLTGAANPIGLCLRGEGPPPFATWAFRPPYLPPDAHIPVASPPDLDVPLLFLRPPAFGAGHPPGGAHPNGARRIERVILTQPGGTAAHPALAALAALEGFTVEDGPVRQATLHVDAPGVDVRVTDTLRLAGTANAAPAVRG